MGNGGGVEYRLLVWLLLHVLSLKSELRTFSSFDSILSVAQGFSISGAVPEESYDESVSLIK